MELERVSHRAESSCALGIRENGNGTVHLAHGYRSFASKQRPVGCEDLDSILWNPEVNGDDLLRP